LGPESDVHRTCHLGVVFERRGAVHENIRSLLDGRMVIRSLRGGLCAAARVTPQARHWECGIVGVGVRWLGAGRGGYELSLAVGDSTRPREVEPGPVCLR